MNALDNKETNIRIGSGALRRLLTQACNQYIHVYTLILIAEKWIAGCAIATGCESDKQKKNERAGRDKEKDKEKGKC